MECERSCGGLGLLRMGRRRHSSIRVCRNQYFEIDVYPFWSKIALAEIELNSEDAEVKFPEQIKIIREVTTEEAFKNASLAGESDLAKYDQN